MIADSVGLGVFSSVCSITAEYIAQEISLTKDYQWYSAGYLGVHQSAFVG